MHARLCGLALARAHDEAGDAARIAGYLGSTDQLDEALGDYAVAWADRVERDHASAAGRLRLRVGVCTHSTLVGGACCS